MLDFWGEIELPVANDADVEFVIARHFGIQLRVKGSLGQARCLIRVEFCTRVGVRKRVERLKSGCTCHEFGPTIVLSLPITRNERFLPQI